MESGGFIASLSPWLFGIIFAAQFLLASWWRFPAASLLLLGLALGAYGPKNHAFLHRLGLRPPADQWLWVSLSLPLAIAVATMTLPMIAGWLGLSLVPHPGISGWLWRCGLFFQVLNEEMLLRGLLLGWLKKRLNPAMIQLLTGGVFCGLHALLYLVMGDVTLSAGAFVTLLCFCLIANLLVLASGHIWYGFALHAAWNLTRFGSSLELNAKPLSEALSFNYFEGSLWPFAVLALSLTWLNSTWSEETMS